MEVRNNIAYSPKPATPSFGAIKFMTAENTLREVLSSKELNKFMDIVAENEPYFNADLVLIGDGKKLYGRICDNVSLKGGKNSSDKSPWFWQNKLEWIAKMAKKMQKRDAEVTELLAKQNFQF